MSMVRCIRLCSPWWGVLQLKSQSSARIVTPFCLLVVWLMVHVSYGAQVPSFKYMYHADIHWLKEGNPAHQHSNKDNFLSKCTYSSCKSCSRPLDYNCKAALITFQAGKVHNQRLFHLQTALSTVVIWPLNRTFLQKFVTRTGGWLISMVKWFGNSITTTIYA